jgi:stress-induced morphogen
MKCVVRTLLYYTQHQMINNILAEEIPHLHGISIKTGTEKPKDTPPSQS